VGVNGGVLVIRASLSQVTYTAVGIESEFTFGRSTEKSFLQYGLRQSGSVARFRLDRCGNDCFWLHFLIGKNHALTVGGQRRWEAHGPADPAMCVDHVPR
jgi:hypothetical protein